MRVLKAGLVLAALGTAGLMVSAKPSQADVRITFYGSGGHGHAYNRYYGGAPVGHFKQRRGGYLYGYGAHNSYGRFAPWVYKKPYYGYVTRRKTPAYYGKPPEIIWRKERPPKYGHGVTHRKICRPFKDVVVIAGRKQWLEGTACRQPGGNWRIVNPG